MKFFQNFVRKENKRISTATDGGGSQQQRCFCTEGNLYDYYFLKGNGIEVNNVQFPEVFAAYKEMVEKLGIKNHLSSTQAAVCYRTAAYQGIPCLSAILLPMSAFDRRRADFARQKGR